MKKEIVDISIIMPVYNGEKFIKKTLEFIRHQTFKNFEVLVINDHSTDSTMDIVDTFVKEDSRFKIFNNTKKGVSSARNTGLKNAKGEYIIHYDADDFIPEHALMSLYENIDNNDIVIGNYSLKFTNSESHVNHEPKFSAVEVIVDLIKNKMHAGLWNKLIRTNLYNDLSFNEDVNYMEDKLILIKILLKNPKIKFINDIVYEYVQHQNSITGSLSSESLHSIKIVILELEENIKNSSMAIDLTVLKIYYKLLAYLNKKEINIRGEFCEVNSKILFCKDISLHHRLFLYLKIQGFNFISDLLIRK